MSLLIIDQIKLLAYQTLYDVILDLIKVLSPVLPFVTERMYLNMTSADKNENKDSIHLSDFPKCDNDKINHELIEKVDSLKKVIESGRAVRKKANIKVRTPLPFKSPGTGHTSSVTVTSIGIEV